ncbi:MAG TPA: type II secretion system protein [Sedimentisphaerales bacterium]|nr:type II secretion system protein [Sedimentisphaerales bacterium]
MPYGKNRTIALRGALTLTEMVIALAIAAIVFSVVLPQLRAIQNSWDSREGASETLQNGRVLMDHLYRRLSGAVRIKKVSGPSETNGYVEFQTCDGNNMRYEVGAGNYVDFGIAGSLADLAGPVSRLQFTCYDAFDLTTPITDVNSIRCVKVQATLTNPARLDEDMTFTTQAYIRTNALPAAGGGISKKSEPWLTFDTIGMESALCQIDQTHYLCAYRGDRDDGYALVLTVDKGNWGVSRGTPFEYDTKNGMEPALCQIDQTHYLCAYRGDGDDGWAVVLTVDTGTGNVSKGPPLEYDAENGLTPALAKIDETHYLCAYKGTGGPMATVLTVGTGTWTITNQPPFPFDVGGVTPELSKIDDTHYLCGYTGPYQDGWSIVLTVDTVDWTVSGETLFGCTAGTYASEPDLAKIDETHCLYVFSTNIWQGCALIITVDPADWTLSKDHAYSHYVFDSVAAHDLELCRIDDRNFLCAYYGPSNVGLVTVLTVDTGDLSISHKPPFTFEPGTCARPRLCQIDAAHYLCAYSGLSSQGYAGVLESRGGILP